MIDPKTTRAVLEVDPTTGHQRPFASISGVDSLSGLAFDDSGGFGDHPLLVTGPIGGKSEVAAIDCHGDVKVITTTAPRLEGGIAVAPTGFGGHGGELVVPDEIGGDIIGIKPDGTTSTIASYANHVGQDVGAESAGFVPKGFISHGGSAYLANRGSGSNPPPGTDTILRLSSAQLSGAGVREGDLLVSTEGGGVTLDVSCAQDCAVRPVAAGPTAGHIEGHVVFLTNQPAPGAIATSPAPKRPVPATTPPPTAATGNGILAAAVAGAGLVILGVALALLVRRRAAG